MDIFISKLEHLDLVANARRQGFLNGFAAGCVSVLVIVASVLAGGCGDNDSTYRQALGDLGVEMHAYADRCAMESWKVNDYEWLICDVTEICELTPSGGCEYVPGPLVACDATRAPAEWSAAECAEALEALPCAEFLTLPESCKVLVPWERGQ
jgi:hypothetical protein